MTELPLTSMGPAALMSRSLIAHPHPTMTTPARPSYVFGSTYSLMSTATLIPAGLTDQGTDPQQKRRSIIDPSVATMIDERAEAQFIRTPSNDQFPPQTSSAPTTTNTATNGGASGIGGEKHAGFTPASQLVVATAPHDCEAKHLHLAAEKIRQLLLFEVLV